MCGHTRNITLSLPPALTWALGVLEKQSLPLRTDTWLRDVHLEVGPSPLGPQARHVGGQGCYTAGLSWVRAGWLSLALGGHSVTCKGDMDRWLERL